MIHILSDRKQTDKLLEKIQWIPIEELNYLAELIQRPVCDHCDCYIPEYNPTDCTGYYTVDNGKFYCENCIESFGQYFSCKLCDTPAYPEDRSESGNPAQLTEDGIMTHFCQNCYDKHVETEKWHDFF